MFVWGTHLQEDAWLIGNFPLCCLLLFNDSNCSWLILAPRRHGISELFQLADRDQQLMWSGTIVLAGLLKGSFGADKINVATLGNVVSQVHMYVIVRYQTDPVCPGYAWGQGSAKPYAQAAVNVIRHKLKSILKSGFIFSDAQS